MSDLGFVLGIVFCLVAGELKRKREKILYIHYYLCSILVANLGLMESSTEEVDGIIWIELVFMNLWRATFLVVNRGCYLCFIRLIMFRR